MTELLFEIFSEPMPLGDKNLSQWKAAVSSVLSEYGVQNYELQVYMTQMRLITVIQNLPKQIDEKYEKVVGPKIEISKKNPNIIERFLQKHSKSESDLIEENGLYHLNLHTPSINIHEIIPEICKKAMQQMKWSKVMFWNKKLGWIRPIRRLVCIFDGSPLLWHMDDICITTSSDFVLNPISALICQNQSINQQYFNAPNFEIYKEKLESHNIFIENKAEKILQQITKTNHEIAQKITNQEINFIENQIESCNVHICEIDDTFDIPRKVKEFIVNEQQHIPIFSDEKITHLVIFAEYLLENNNDLIHQTLTTLKSRLNDGLFFWNKDMNHDLNYYTNKLNRTNFFTNLGTLKQKQDRIINIAQQILPNEPLQEAIEIFQVDLCMQTVDNHPKLQGLISHLYAKKLEKNDITQKILLDQYTRQYNSIESMYLKFIYELDNVIGFIGVGLKPSGSSDPLAIRRKCLEIIELAYQMHLQQFTINIQNHINLLLSEFSKQQIELDLSEFHDYFVKRLNYVTKQKYPNEYKFIQNIFEPQQAFQKLNEIQKCTNIDLLQKTYNRITGFTNNSNNKSKSQNHEIEKDTIHSSIDISNLEPQLHNLYKLIHENHNNPSIDNLVNVSENLDVILQTHNVSANVDLQSMLIMTKNKFDNYAIWDN